MLAILAGLSMVMSVAVVAILYHSFYDVYRRKLDNSKLIRGFTPGGLRKRVDDFERRMKIETPRIKKALSVYTFDGIEVFELGHLCWWRNTDHSFVLAGARLSNGKFVILSYRDGAISLLSLKEPQAQLVLDNLFRIPHVSFDDGEIRIGFAVGRYLLVRNGYKDGWEWHGMGWSGCRAQGKFAEHGMTFDASSS